MSKAISNSNYYTVQGWMVNDLGLQGDELTVYAILWGFSQDGKTASRTPKQYFMGWTGKGKDATIDTINSLLGKGLIERVEIKGQTPEYRCKIRPVEKSDPSENQTGVVGILHPHPSENPTPINNINNNNITRDAHAHTREDEDYYTKDNELFEEWWQLYGGQGGKGGCLSYWRNLSDEEKAQVISHTKRYKEVAVSPLTPYNYLVTFPHWRNEKPMREQPKSEQPKNDLPDASGKVLVRIDGQLALVDKEQAEKDGLKIIADYGNNETK